MERVPNPVQRTKPKEPAFMNRRSFFQATLAGLVVLGGVAAPSNPVQAQKKSGKSRKPRSKEKKKKHRNRRRDTLRLFLHW